MGVCEGSPRSIIPDHMGRADFHGAAINTAARYMEVAAHGGQVSSTWGTVGSTWGQAGSTLEPCGQYQAATWAAYRGIE